MIPSLTLFKLFLAGGSSFLGSLTVPNQPALENHTLAGEKIKASNVVCRTCWGTPMPPDERAGYRVTAPLRPSLIRESLWVPPVNNVKPPVKPVVAPKQASVPAPALPAQPQSSQSPSGSSAKP